MERAHDLADDGVTERRLLSHLAFNGLGNNLALDMSEHGILLRDVKTEEVIHTALRANVDIKRNHSLTKAESATGQRDIVIAILYLMLYHAVDKHIDVESRGIITNITLHHMGKLTANLLGGSHLAVLGDEIVIRDRAIDAKLDRCGTINLSGLGHTVDDIHKNLICRIGLTALKELGHVTEVHLYDIGEGRIGRNVHITRDKRRIILLADKLTELVGKNVSLDMSIVGGLLHLFSFLLAFLALNCKDIIL